uniref:RING-type domain-containing protein n=1 Tax=Oryza punctata TaxID=4537 RepID=A0A0E0KED3_ORYPU
MDSGRAGAAVDDSSAADAEAQASLLELRQFMDTTLNDIINATADYIYRHIFDDDDVVPTVRSSAAAAAAPTRASSRAAIEAPRDDVDDEQDNCAICLDKDDAAAAEWKETPCGHRFHGGCLEKWLKAAHTTCPMCRRHLAMQAAYLQASNDVLAELLSSTSRGAAAGAAAASDEAIQALNDVGGDVDGGQKLDCAICLDHDDASAATAAAGGWKEMPCGHRFHGGCLEKWLRMHGTCPMCRHQMPAPPPAEVVEGAALEVTTSGTLLLIARDRANDGGAAAADGVDEDHYRYGLYEIGVQYYFNFEINP